MPRASCWLVLACCFAGPVAAQSDPVMRHVRTVKAESIRAFGRERDYTPALLAQIRQESAGNERAVSRAGARGLTQFMPATFADMQRQYPEIGADVFNPRTAIAAQSRYMFIQWNYFKDVTDACQRMGYAFSGYNGGAGYALRRKKASPNPQDFFNTTRFINPGILPSNQKENEEYAHHILFKHQPKYAAYGVTLCIPR